jgi:hypothetical protein
VIRGLTVIDLTAGAENAKPTQPVNAGRITAPNGQKNGLNNPFNDDLPQRVRECSDQKTTPREPNSATDR